MILVFITLITIALLVHKPYFRYIGPAIPFIYMVVAVLIRATMQLHFLIGAGLIVVWLFTGNMDKYLYQLNHDYKGPMEGICRFLNEHARPSDTVAIPYGDLPVKFYTDLRVIGALSGEDYKPAAEADWIIMRTYSIMEEDAKMKRYLKNNIDFSMYKRARINYPDLPYQNREVPNLHKFKTVKNAPRVKILKRFDKR